MALKTFYEGHEKAYRIRKERGALGWDESEEGYDKFKALIESTIAKGNAPRNGRLLEIGCGAGNLAVWLAEKGYEVYGVDISPTAVQWAQQRAQGQGVKVNFAVGDVCDLRDYQDGFFDFVLDGHCLHCIIGGDRERLLKSVRRVLKLGGYFLVSTMCDPVDTTAIQGFDPESRCTICNGIASRYVGLPDDIIQEIDNSGFEVVRWHVEEDETASELVVEAVSLGS